MRKIWVLCLTLSTTALFSAQAASLKVNDPWLLVDRALTARLEPETKTFDAYIASLHAAEKALQSSGLDSDTRQLLPKVLQAYVEDKIPESIGESFQRDLQSFVEVRESAAHILELQLGDTEEIRTQSFNPSVEELKQLIASEISSLEAPSGDAIAQRAQFSRLLFLFLRISRKEDRLALLGKRAELAALIEQRLNLREKASQALGISPALIDPTLDPNAAPKMPEHADFDFYSKLEKFYTLRKSGFDDPEVKDLSLNGFFIQIQQLEAEALNWEVSKIPGAPGEEASLFVSVAPTIIAAYVAMHLEARDILNRDLKVSDYSFFSNEAKALAEEIPMRQLSHEKLQVAADPVSGELKQQTLTDSDAIEYYRFFYRARFFVFLLTQARLNIRQQVVRMAPNMPIYKDLGASLELLEKALSADTGLPRRIFWIPQDVKNPF